MGIVIRQSARTLILTYMGFAIAFINSLYLFPKALSAEQIGLQALLINLATMFSSFACLGTPQISIRYFPYFRDSEKGNNGFLFFLFVLSSIGFVLFLIIFLSFRGAIVSAYSKNAPLLTDYFYYLIPFTFVVLLTIILEAFAVTQLKPVVPRFIKDIFIRVLLAFGAAAILLRLINFFTFINLLLLIYILAVVLLAIYLHSIGQLHLRPNFSVFKSEMLKPILVFSGFMLMATTSDTIIRNIDALMLGAYSGLRSNGIYYIALNIALVIDIPRRSISQVIAPLVAEATKNNEIRKIEELYKKSSINQLIIGGLVFLVIWCNLDSIFKVIPRGNIYILGKWAFFYYGLGKMFDLATGINAEIIGYSKYYRLDLFFYALLSLLAIGINLLLIPAYGLTGAAMAAALSLVLINTYRYLLILNKIKIQPFSFNTLKVLFAGGIVILLNYTLPHIQNHFLLDTAVRGLFITIIFLGLSVMLKASEDINNFLVRVINRYR